MVHVPGKLQKLNMFSSNIMLFQILKVHSYIFSHDPKGPEELSFRLKRKCLSIRHYLDPWGETEDKVLSDSANFLMKSKHHMVSHISQI